MNRILSSFIVSVSLASAPLLAAAEDSKPDATIEISGKTVAAGVGYTQGSGTLRYGDRSYPLHLEGLSVGSVGAASITASGNVYHLARLEDLDGNYTAISAGATLGNGGAASSMQNQNGVVIELHSTTEGVHANVSIDGFTLKLAR
jgi:hypothetical protein